MTVRLFPVFALLLAAPATAASIDAAQKPLPTQPITIVSPRGTHRFTAEMATTPREQEIGLMYRTDIPADHGMFFDWGAPRDVPMWMKNCPVPEDMIFIAEDGTIARIAENTVPESEANIPSGPAIRATLELQGGITEKLDIRVGDHVTGGPFLAR